MIVNDEKMMLAICVTDINLFLPRTVQICVGQASEVMLLRKISNQH